MPNQSIAIYRSIFKCLAVDRGWFYACTYILIKIFQNINWNNYAFVHFLYFQFGIFPLFKINFISTVLYLLSYINNITVIIVVVYDVTFTKNLWNKLHWADLLISSLFQLLHFNFNTRKLLHLSSARCLTKLKINVLLK